MTKKTPPKKKITPKDPEWQGTKNLMAGKADNWKKGQSGNPAGRPKGSKNRSTVIAELLSLNLTNAEGGFVPNPLDPKEKKITYEKAIMVALVKRALKGNVPAIQEIQNTVFGKMKDSTEHTGQDGESIKMETTLKEEDKLLLDKVLSDMAKHKT